MKHLKLLKNVMMIVIILSSFSSIAKEGSKEMHHKNETLIPVNPIFRDLLNELSNSRSCYSVNISSVTIRNYQKTTSYSTFGSFGYLKKQSPSSIKSFDVSTSFSDRGYFTGKKTIENFTISGRGNQVNVKIVFKTWSNETVTLRNVKIVKVNNGYFITGNFTKGIRSVYYTLAIYKGQCLI